MTHQSATEPAAQITPHVGIGTKTNPFAGTDKQSGELPTNFYAANILNPHHTTAMAATMLAAVRARSRTWIFIGSIPFSSLPRAEGM
jgi:hypothetical protein